MELSLQVEQESDGRWIAEVPQLPGVIVYGESRADAISKAQVLALRVLAEGIEHSGCGPEPVHIVLPDAA